MSWLFQPLPLASTFSVTDVDEALDASATSVTTGHGTLTPVPNVPLVGSESASGIGSMSIVDDEEQLQGIEIAGAQGSLVRSNFVRLRSRKVGGGTADNILTGQQALVQTTAPANGISVLLGGTGVTTAQQSFPTKTRSCLLTGQVRTMNAGTLTYVPITGGTSFPSYFQLPTQLDEQNAYDNVLNWTYTSTDFDTNFAASPPTISFTDIHDTLESDDLWNHYHQWKRTSGANKLIFEAWKNAWRDWYVNTYPTQVMTDDGPPPAGRYFDHLFGQGLCMLAVEQGDLGARAAADSLATNLKSIHDTYYNLVPGVANMSGGGSRRHARWLLFMNYYVVVNPAAEWIAFRDHLLDCWVQSSGWLDSTTSNIVVGGNHFCGIGHFSSTVRGETGLLQSDFTAGYRVNSVFQYALHTEALWLAYKMTGRQDVRDMLIAMARYTLHYAWDPTMVNSFCGAWYGHGPDGSRYHSYEGSLPVVHPTAGPWTNPGVAPTSNYEASPVNTLVYGYKLTGEAAFLTKAQQHLRKATQYANDAPGETKLSDTEVHFFLDTRRQTPETFLFENNKGQLQYASYVFENGGVPATEEVWPPYQVPATPGQVVPIASQTGLVNLTDPTRGGGSTYNTNIWSDVRPLEVGSEKAGNQMLTTTDSTCTLIESYSRGGAIVVAGTGGHHGTINFGAAVFDFEDGLWKRVWTGGTTTASRNAPQDLRSNTRIHNCLNWEEDLIECYRSNDGFSPPDWNSDHWNPSSLELSIVPRTTDPRDQSWEVSRVEPYPYSATTVPPGASGSAIQSGPHGWLYPGEWNGDHSQAYPGRFTRNGYVAPAGRFDPTPAGTLSSTQSEMPIPSHAWDMMFEMSTDQGGGSKGSIVLSRHMYGGANGVLSTYISHRFDLDTGTWHQYSINSSERPSGQTTNSPDAEGSIAGALDVHPTTGKRRYFVIGQRTLSKDPTKLLYLNLDDRTWRSATIGTGDSSPSLNAPRTEAIACDPDRRLLVLTIGANPASSTSSETHSRFRAFDLSTLTPEPNPTTGTGGWRTLPVTAAAGFSISGAVNPYLNIPIYPWVYYPPNGKYYRLVPNNRPIPTMAEYHANTAAGQALRMMNTLQRLTPPAIISNPPAGYYFTQPWTYDEITLGSSIPRGSYHYMIQASGNQWFKYIPSLQCLAWFPLDHASVEPTPSSRHCVYLIKPI